MLLTMLQYQFLLISCIKVIINYQKLLNFDVSFMNLSLKCDVKYVCQQISRNYLVTAFHSHKDLHNRFKSTFKSSTEKCNVFFLTRERLSAPHGDSYNLKCLYM